MAKKRFPLTRTFPLDLIDEKVNQTAVNNTVNTIQQNNEADEEAFIILSEQRQLRNEIHTSG